MKDIIVLLRKNRNCMVSTFPNKKWNDTEKLMCQRRKEEHKDKNGNAT